MDFQELVCSQKMYKCDVVFIRCNFFCRWEDNWLTDIYLPFESVFYQKGVIVENYVGLESNEVVKPVEGIRVNTRHHSTMES